MTVEAAGVFRRTPLERSDQRVAWNRTDQAFFAAGACHILAWTCREMFPEQPIGLAAIRLHGEHHVFHTYATWEDWAFDHSGWNPEPELIASNADFEGHRVERIEITSSLVSFCAQQYHRMPQDYWQDPRPRARKYIQHHLSPWAETRDSKATGN